MGMISEANAEYTAKRLEKIILKAMSDPHWSGVRSEIQDFARKELVEWYYDECGDTWGSYKPNSEIVEMFPPKS